MELLTVLVLALAFSNSLGPTTAGLHDQANHPFNYVVVIVMENQGFGDIINNPSALFMNQLASSYALCSQPSKPAKLPVAYLGAGFCILEHD